MAHNNELINEMVNSFCVDMTLTRFSFFVCAYLVFGTWNTDYYQGHNRPFHIINFHRHLSFIKKNICNLSYALRERNQINFLSFLSFIVQPIRNVLNDSEK